jgi:hypothetical protein
MLEHYSGIKLNNLVIFFFDVASYMLDALSKNEEAGSTKINS